jgi:hypothetical protein
MHNLSLHLRSALCTATTVFSPSEHANLGWANSLYGDPGLLIMFKKSSSCVFIDSSGGGLFLSVMDEHECLFPPHSLVPRLPSLPSPWLCTLSRCPFRSLKLCRVVGISKTQTRCISPSSHCVASTLPGRILTPWHAMTQESICFGPNRLSTQYPKTNSATMGMNNYYTKRVLASHAIEPAGCTQANL